MTGLPPTTIYFGRSPSGIGVVFINNLWRLDEEQLHAACERQHVPMDTVWSNIEPQLTSWERQMYDVHLAAAIAEIEAHLKEIREASHE